MKKELLKHFTTPQQSIEKRIATGKALRSKQGTSIAVAIEAIARGEHYAWTGYVRPPCGGCGLCGMSRGLSALAHGDLTVPHAGPEGDILISLGRVEGGRLSLPVLHPCWGRL